MSNGIRARKPTAYLQYALSGGDAPFAIDQVSFTSIPFSEDRNSFPEAFFDKPTDERFRALFDCVVRVTYNLIFDADGSGTHGIDFRALLNNSTSIADSECRDTTQSDPDDAGHTTKVFLVPLSANDFFEIQAQATEQDGSVLDAQSTVLCELVRLT